MSNVLIGIIGVILFIGLALAGALFLGPRFQESTNNSKASAQVAAMHQIANAANMYQVNEGKQTLDINVLKSGGYLKSVPSDMSGANAYFIMVADGSVRHVLIGSQPKMICQAFNRQVLGSAVIGTDFDYSKPALCYGDDASGYFMALKV